MSWRNHLLTWALRRWIKPNSRRDLDVAVSRALAARMPFGARRRPGWRVRPVVAPGPAGDWIEPVAPDHPARQRCILYLHGGAYVAMSARTHRALTSRLAQWSDARLFALDYRLAPEHPFPAALDDAVAAYAALIAAGAHPSRLVVAGDSAGGGLALAMLVALRARGDPLPAAAVLFSPWTDLAATGDSISDNSDSDALLFGSWVAPAARHYLGETAATNPLASPLYADLTGLPPMLIQASDSEILRDDSCRICASAKTAGVDATLQLWPGLPHCWHLFAAILPEGRQALWAASRFIAARLGAETGG